MIIQTRIIPPRIPQNIIHRNELIGLLNKNIGIQLLLISSPAGYGKTTLVQDFLNNTRHRYCWLHITSDLNNIFTFTSYLIHSLNKVNSKFGKDTLALLLSLQEEFVNQDIHSKVIQLMGSIINELLNSFEDTLFIVLDDLHIICDSEWFESAISALIYDLPQNIHVIVTSRYPAVGGLPGFSSLKAKGYVFELSANELSFKQNEIYGLLEKVYSYKKIDENLINFLNNFKGWITGIHLFLLHWTPLSQSFQKLPDNIVGISEAKLSNELYDYFANEIFKNINPDIQNFLLNTSLLSNFDEEVCNNILGIDNSSELLNELLNKNIFIEAKENETGKLIYNFQPLFSVFLNKKATELLGKKHLVKILLKVSEYYEIKNEPLNVIEYSLKGKDWDKVLYSIYVMLPVLIQDSQFELIHRWLNEINAPDSGQSTNSWSGQYQEGIYRYLKAVVERYYTGDAQTALEEIYKADEIISKTIETPLRQSKPWIKLKDLKAKCDLLEIELLLKLGRIDAAIEKINNNLQVFTHRTAVSETSYKKEQTDKALTLEARYFYLLGYAYHNKSEFTNAEKYLNLAAELSIKQNNTDLLYDTYNILGNVFLKKGDFIKAIHYYELTLLKSRNLFNKFTVLSNLSILYARSYKAKESQRYFYEAETLYNSLHTPVSKGLNTAFLMLKYALHFEFMDWESALQIAKEIHESATKNNDIMNIYLSLIFIGECYYYLDMIEHAKQYYMLAAKYCDMESYSDRIYNDFLHGLIAKKEGLYKKIEDNFLNAYAFYDSEESHYDKSITSFHTADLYLKMNKKDSALHYLKTTLNICSQKDNISFLIREYFMDKSLFDFAIENKIDISFVGQIASLAFGSAEAEDNAVRQDVFFVSEESRLRLQERILNSYDLIIRLFDEPEIIVRGKKITDDKWNRKKRKLIFLYIALNHNKIITKDKLVDMFFTDTPAESIDNQFHQAMSNIRSAIKATTAADLSVKQGSKAKKSSDGFLKSVPSFLTYEDKIIRLNPAYTYFIDVLEFEKYYNRYLSASTDADTKISCAEKAIMLYRGDFMSGCYDTWCEDLRTDYKNKIIKLLNSASLLTIENNKEKALIFLHKLLAIDKLNEDAFLNLITLLVKLNRHEEAVSAIHKFKQDYKNDMDEDPPADLVSKITKQLKKE